jgi:signal transduction histidine kinase/CheY-like chemotaxis protein
MRLFRIRELPLGLHLFVIVTGVLLPFVAFIFWLVSNLSDSREAMAKRLLLENARDLSHDIDLELQATIRVLRGLSCSESLLSGKYDTFHREAQRVLMSQPSWRTIMLFSPDEKAILNAAQPIGQHRGSAIEPGSLRSAIESGAVVVGVSMKGSEGVRALPIRVPVFIDSKLAYILTAVIDAATWQAIAERSPDLHEVWMRTIVESNGMVLARSRAPEKFVGTAATPSFLAASADEAEKVIEDVTLDHQSVFLALSHSRLSGWVAAVAAPKGAILGPGSESIERFVLLGIIFTALSSSLAFIYGIRVSQITQRLVKNVVELPDGVPISHPETSVREVNILTRALRDAGNKLIEKERAVNDILQRLQESRRLAEEANASKDRFLAMLGHELRNPMAAVTSALEILNLTGDSTSPDAVEARHIMERQLEIANGLLSDLLDVSRISRGKITLDRSDFVLNELLSEIVADYDHLFRTKRLRVDLILPSESIIISADHRRIRQVIGNILHNSVKFTKEGGFITVTLKKCNRCVQIGIADSGPGFDPAVLPHLFEPFVQAEQDYARSLGGLGLGLSVVKGVVELHGGSVRAKNREDSAGAVVEFELPIRVMGGDISDASDEGPLPQGKSLSLVIVEDNRDTASALSRVLKLDGHDVSVAHCGLDGIRVVEEVRPDLVLCDLGLPDIDGYEVCRRLRANSELRGMKIVAVSGYALPADVKIAENAGFDRHFKKPLDSRIFREFVTGLQRLSPPQSQLPD